MTVKRTILSILGRDDLKAILDELEIDCAMRILRIQNTWVNEQ